jgi:SAM-dependent methyltransferase
VTHSGEPLPFAGTAWYYARYHVPYPADLIRDLIDEFGLDGKDRLLDIGCGTGAVALKLRHVFEEVVGIDRDDEMIAEAKRQGAAEGATNVRWLSMPAESVPRELGEFRLVTLGSSLHWMDRDRVLALAYDLLTDGGGIAVASGVSGFWDTSGLWGGLEPWQREVVDVVKRYLGEERRAGGGTYAPPKERHERVLERSRFEGVKRKEYRVDQVWDYDSVIGYLYSTSFAAKPLFGDRAPAFEQDVRDLLSELSADGQFRETLVFESLLARKR